jgi:hypothetical protein
MPGGQAQPANRRSITERNSNRNPRIHIPPDTRGTRAAADGSCTGHRTSGSGLRWEDKLPRRRRVFTARET